MRILTQKQIDELMLTIQDIDQYSEQIGLLRIDSPSTPKLKEIRVNRWKKIKQILKCKSGGYDIM